MSSLSELLDQVRQPMAECAAAVRSNARGPVVLFVSMTDGQSRARTVRASGPHFDAAWRNASHASEALAVRLDLKVRWLRVDVAHDVQATTMSELQALLAQTKRGHFRYGLALDADLHRAFLEPELNANAMLCLGSESTRAGINHHSFAAQVQRRFGSQGVPDFAVSSPVWVFAHEGVFVSDDPTLVDLPGGKSLAWVPSPGRCGLPWSDPDSLNAGRRELEVLRPDAVFGLVGSCTWYLARQMLPSGQLVDGHFQGGDQQVPVDAAWQHTSALHAMLEAWDLLRDKEVLAVIRRALAYMAHTLVRQYPQPDGSVLAYSVGADGEIKLGNNALSLLALVKYVELTGDTQCQPLMVRLALGIAAMQDPCTGRFVHVLNDADLSPKESSRMAHCDGQAALGLIRLYELTRDERWLPLVEKAFGSALQDDHALHLDHWLLYGVNELTRYRPEDRYLRFGAETIVDWLGVALTRENTCPTLMALAMAFRAMLTRLEQDHGELRHVLNGVDRDKLQRALRHHAHYMLNGFFWPEMAMFFDKPASLVGGFFSRDQAFRVQIHDVQHHLLGYVSYWKLLQLDTQSLQSVGK